MVRYPEVYKKAQAEIDRVVGRERLPDFDDREHLPYLECVVKEVFRCVTYRLPTLFDYSQFSNAVGGTPPSPSVSAHVVLDASGVRY